MKQHFRRFLRYLIGVVAAIAIIIVALYVYMQAGLPDVSVLNKIHTAVSIDQIPKPLIQAVLATEDNRFYSHPGVDVWGMMRATAVVITTGRKAQGGSTITMQVARHYFLTRKKTYLRKAKELLLAIKINQIIPRDKILELYLNNMYFGNRAYGVAAAAKVYYHKTLKQLTLPEMAMIAGILQTPSRVNPIANPEAALKRRNHVLKRMFTVGYIDRQTYEKSVNTN